MADIKVICDRDDLVAIADAVRSKIGTTQEMTLDGIATNINKIAAGGGIVLPTLVNEGDAHDMLSGKQLIDSEGNIVTGTIPTKNSNDLTVSGATVSVPAGYYAESVSKNVSAVTQATPTVSVDENGLITAMTTQTAGYVAAGTKSATKQLVVQSTKTVTPTATSQTAVAAGVYTTGAITVSPIPAEYVIPQGELEVSKNGTYNVANKASVVVSVPERAIVLQNKEITENGTYTADVGYDGFGQVIINVPSGGVVEPDYKDLYQRVEYITSAVEETYPYIITDFYGDNESGLEVIASFPKLQDRIPMGSRENSDATRFYCVYPMSSSSIYYGFNTGSSVSCSLKVDTIYRLQTNFLNSRLVNVFDMDGVRKGGTSLSTTLTTQTAPVSIFGYHSASSGAVSSKREFKLYSARCSKRHEVVREYIPCYRKSDGVVGVYEKCTGQFLTSAVDAVFTKGADIDW